MIEQVQKSDSLLADRKVLIVDDDVRNIFAITSALEASKMDVKYAESGQAAHRPTCRKIPIRRDRC